MDERINATCTICGKGYHMCLSCKDKMKLSPWKIHTDTAEHYKIHQIIHGFSTKVYTRDEAKSKLKNVDLSDLETFMPNIKLIIKDILKEDTVEINNTVDKNIAVTKKAIASKKKYRVEIE